MYMIWSTCLNGQINTIKVEKTNQQNNNKKKQQQGLCLFPILAAQVILLSVENDTVNKRFEKKKRIEKTRNVSILLFYEIVALAYVLNAVYI